MIIFDNRIIYDSLSLNSILINTYMKLFLQKKILNLIKRFFGLKSVRYIISMCDNKALYSYNNN